MVDKETVIHGIGYEHMESNVDRRISDIQDFVSGTIANDIEIGKKLSKMTVENLNSITALPIEEIGTVKYNYGGVNGEPAPRLGVFKTRLTLVPEQLTEIIGSGYLHESSWVNCLKWMMQEKLLLVRDPNEDLVQKEWGKITKGAFYQAEPYHRLFLLNRRGILAIDSGIFSMRTFKIKNLEFWNYLRRLEYQIAREERRKSYIISHPKVKDTD